jgi:cellulose synthase/poly-beta-1,6-N-acetylglucosamine synthase-like glycosyltransferase
MALLEVALGIVALGLLVPAAMLLLECAARLAPARSVPPSHAARPSVVVIVPAHDEASRIGACLDALGRQVGRDDRVIVVADNCVDDTAARAAAHGVTVLERTDPRRRGKGYALLHALDAIAAAPPDVVIVLDADSAIGPDLVATLARAASSTHRPVQAAYLPELPPQPGALDRLSGFAFVMKNVTRPTGLARLGLPCLLAGTGMAFPWAVIHGAPIVGDRTAEDMRLAVDLSLAGHSPVFCPEARLTGPIEKWTTGATVQRTRWEHGHLETLLASVRPLLAAAIGGRRPRLLALALELGVPPLSLWALSWTTAAALATVLISIGGSAVPLALLVTGGAFVAGAVALAWVRDGRPFVPAHMLVATAGYVLRKLPVYAAFPHRRRSTWATRAAGPPAAVPSGPRRDEEGQRP